MNKENINTILKIEEENGNKRAKFLNIETSKFENIENITKENIIKLIDYIIKNDDVGIDTYIDGLLQNPVQDIIYKNLFIKFDDLIKNKNDILKKIDEDFKIAENEYTK